MLSKTEFLPKTHIIALVFCSLLVLTLAVWPSKGQSVVVNLPSAVPVPEVLESRDSEPKWQKVSEFVVAGDTLSTVFERSGAGVTVLYNLMTNNDIKKPMEKIFPGQEFVFSFNSDKTLTEISFNESPTISYKISVGHDQQWQIQKIERTPDILTKYAKATINDSLFLDGKKAGLTDNMIMQLATIFGWDIDFALDIRSGDEFSLLYEENYLDGKKLSDGPIIAARFINNGREITAIRYTDPSGRTDYFSADGASMRKAFLRTPLDVFRISSSFNLRRKHPILNKIVAHKGTDYAAPIGTPIKAAGDGKVIKAYKSATYGNVVVLQHGGNIRTLYAHMSKFSKYAKVGKYVKQGQIVGYVGMTGRATGPHLHYEFQVNGVHKNPQTVKLPNAEPLKKDYRNDFNQYAKNLVGQLSVYDAATTASGPANFE